jgi:hypothetical protein
MSLSVTIAELALMLLGAWSIFHILRNPLK